MDIGGDHRGTGGAAFPERSETRDATRSGAATGDGRESPPRVEGYQVGERLGQGGMGVVYRAVQLSTQREVALKVMRLSFVEPTAAAAQRFQREVKLASRLSHPRIARV